MSMINRGMEDFAMHEPFAVETVDLALAGISGASPIARSRRRQWGWYGTLLAPLLISIGCDDSGLNLVPVEGVILFQGRPLQDAGVMFMPVDSAQGPPASGTTDAAGKFTLATANRPGAVVGKHRVAISKADAFGAEVPIEHMENPDLIRSRGVRVFQPKYHIPPQYAEVENSGLTATVNEDDNSFEFKLSDRN
jgi:hypothetical protein